MTPERCAEVVARLRTCPRSFEDGPFLRDAANELEATAARRADLAKAKERIAELEQYRHDVLASGFAQEVRIGGVLFRRAR